MKWWQIGAAILLVIGGIWVYRFVSTPVPGRQMGDQGREHVTAEEAAKFNYNSNPPTSGPHLPTWVKSGVYAQPQSEGELIHSLEHGYVIISYNCNVHLKAASNKRQVISKIYAHEEAGATPSADFIDPIMATGSAVNETEQCQTLIRQLKDLAEKKKLWKLIVVPRPRLDTTIALTAWTYIDAFDPPAGGSDAKRIEAFIDFHRDHGPEKTME